MIFFGVLSGLRQSRTSTLVQQVVDGLLVVPAQFALGIISKASLKKLDIRPASQGETVAKDPGILATSTLHGFAQGLAVDISDSSQSFTHATKMCSACLDCNPLKVWPHRLEWHSRAFERLLAMPVNAEISVKRRGDLPCRE